MDKKIEIDKIIVLLRSWVSEIQFNTKLDFYDINKISEGFSAKLLNAIFGYNLKDLNKVKKNFPGIDLGDDIHDKIAFQITSRTDFQKFKEALETFVKKDKNGKCLADTFTNGIKFLVISIEEIKKGKTDLTNIYPNFNFGKDILKVEDLLPFIDDLYDNDSTRFLLVKQVLEEQFSNKVNNNLTPEKKEQFLKEYEKVTINNFSRINFFGLDLPKRPREIQLYSLFVEPTFKPYKDNSNKYNTYFDKKIVDIQYQSDFQYKSDIPLSLFEFNKIENSDFYSTNYPYKNIRLALTKLQDNSLSKLYTSINYFEDLTSFYTKEEKVIPYKNLFNSRKSKVIIGNPGAGKSLFVKQSICKILSKDRTQFESEYVYDTIPFRIELFKFNKDRKDKGIEYYLYNYLKNTLDLSWITEEFISNIFETHQTLVFYDGLDEIFDIHERLEVRDLIENFTIKHDKSISIVTSRFESYEEVNLSTNVFDTIQILDFNEAQIIDYVNKWYNIEEESEYSRPIEVKNCLDQLSRVDKELTNSPLLLSLILILYRNQLDIPTTKLEIYESCANTLIETRDVKEKKLDLNFKIKNKASAFAHVAFWQFNLQNGKNPPKDINFSLVLEELKKYLLLQNNTSFEDDHSATIAVKEFLDYAKNRSIYVENNFTHKSFLEYFTAYYLYSNFYYKGKHDYIHKVIAENINKSSWFVVLELLICKIDTGQPDYDIIDSIIEKQFLKNDINSVIFFMQILHHIRNISNSKINELISKSIDLIVAQKTDNSTLIFDSLIHLAAMQRFRLVIQNQFNQKINSLTLDNPEVNKYYMINLEANLVAEKENTLGIEYNVGNIKDPYIFILEVYPSLMDWTKYFELLKYYMSKYDREKVTNGYHSLTKSKIFFGNSKFNWVISCLFTFNDKRQFLKNYSKLKVLGFKGPEIVKIVKNERNGFNISQELLNSYYGVKDQSINNFLNQISRILFLRTCEEDINEKNKFYDKHKTLNKFHK